MHRLIAWPARFAVLGLVLAGCAGPGQGVVDAIRAAKSPIVREVVFSPANPAVGRHEEIYVLVVEGTTPAQALDLWCSVVLPAGAARLEPGAVSVLNGGEVMTGGGRSGETNALPENPVCPPPTPPS
jgi:hypothetical protein